MAYPNKQSLATGAIPVWIAGGGASPGIPPGLSLLDFQQITDLSSAVALPEVEGATMALVQVNAGVVRYRRDGTDPTESVGMLMYATGPAVAFTIGAALKFIQNSGSTGSLNIEYYGPA